MAANDTGQVDDNSRAPFASMNRRRTVINSSNNNSLAQKLEMKKLDLQTVKYKSSRDTTLLFEKGVNDLNALPRTVPTASSKDKLGEGSSSKGNVKKIQYFKRKVSSTYNTFKKSMRGYDQDIKSRKRNTFMPSSMKEKQNHLKTSAAHYSDDDLIITNSKRYSLPNRKKRFSKTSTRSVIVVDTDNAVEMRPSQEEDEMRLLEQSGPARYHNRVNSNWESSLASSMDVSDSELASGVHNLYGETYGVPSNARGLMPDTNIHDYNNGNFAEMSSILNHNLGSLRSNVGAFGKQSHVFRSGEVDKEKICCTTPNEHNTSAMLNDLNADSNYTYTTDYFNREILDNSTVQGSKRNGYQNNVYNTTNNLHYSTLLNSNSSRSSRLDITDNRSQQADTRSFYDIDTAQGENDYFEESLRAENFASNIQHAYNNGDQINGEFTAISRESIEQIIQHIFSIPNRNSNTATEGQPAARTQGNHTTNAPVSSIYFEMTIDILEMDDDDALSNGSEF